MAGEADRPLGTVSIINSPRREQHQAGPIMAADRDFFDLGRFNNTGKFCVGTVGGLRRGIHRDDFGDPADFQTGIDCSSFAVLKIDISNCCCFEACGRDLERITTDRQRRDFVKPL